MAQPEMNTVNISTERTRSESGGRLITKCIIIDCIIYFKFNGLVSMVKVHLKGSLTSWSTW